MTHQILIIFLLNLACTVYAQEKIDLLDSNLELYYSKIVEDGIEYSREGYFKMLNGKKLEWIQNASEKVYSFDITWIDGEWSDFKEKGSLRMDIMLNNRTGKAILIRDLNGLTITIKLVARSGIDMISTCKIHRFEIL